MDRKDFVSRDTKSTKNINRPPFILFNTRWFFHSIIEYSVVDTNLYQTLSQNNKLINIVWLTLRRMRLITNGDTKIVHELLRQALFARFILKCREKKKEFRLLLANLHSEILNVF